MIRFGYIYNSYKNGLYYWEFIKIYLLLIAVGVNNAIQIDLKTKGLIIFYLVFIYLMVFTLNKPYKTHSLNKIEKLSIVVTLVNFLTAILIKYTMENEY